MVVVANNTSAMLTRGSPSGPKCSATAIWVNTTPCIVWPSDPYTEDIRIISAVAVHRMIVSINTLSDCTSPWDMG